jgi:hypothetical protein
MRQAKREREHTSRVSIANRAYHAMQHTHAVQRTHREVTDRSVGQETLEQVRRERHRVLVMDSVLLHGV